MEEEKLTFEDCAPAFYKWAWHFQSKRFEFWELINAAWLDSGFRSLPKSKIKFASGRIRYGMIDYMRKETKYRQRKRAEAKGKPFPWMHNFSENLMRKGKKTKDLIENMRADVVDVEQKDFIDHLVDRSGLTRSQKLAVRLYFLDGFTQREVSKVIGLTESRISQILGIAVGLMKSNRAISKSEMEE